MKVLYVYCHPLPDSFHGAIRGAALAALDQHGHAVDLLDLYAESFEPALTAQQRRVYFDPALNHAGLADYVARLKAAEALVVQFPTWCFGPPAMLKGYFDRLMIPGVAYDTQDSKPTLGNFRKIVGVVTYGQSWTTALWMGEAPRKMVTRFLRWFSGGKAETQYHALYNIDRSSEAARKAFILRIEKAMAAI
ncbi:MAG: NAD(P)H-dependent oxidoreductase [Caulobacteraceae bacterium]|nr:NAD(P)H-dependent oxidoreductase [Caulobacteraceae bacterium]